MRLSALVLSFGLLVGLTAAGCSLWGQGDTLDLSQAYLFPSCAPTDGPALDLYVTDGPARCDNLYGSLTETNTVRISLYGFVQPTIPSTVPLSAPSTPGYSDGGLATYCPEAEACVNTQQGTVQFLAEQDGAVVVAVDLTFEDGHRVSGTFTAETCTRRFLCG